MKETNRNTKNRRQGTRQTTKGKNRKTRKKERTEQNKRERTKQGNTRNTKSTEQLRTREQKRGPHSSFRINNISSKSFTEYEQQNNLNKKTQF